MEAPRISLAELRGYIADAGELSKGTQIADGGLLLNLSRHENRLYCEAKGSGQAPYRVSVTFAEQAGAVTARCSCMAARSRPFCKHSAALLVSWARSPESFVVSEAPPVVEGTARRTTVKAGKASGVDLMRQGVERVTTLVRELAVAGIAAAGTDRVEQVRQLGEALRENRLRRLSARTLELSQMIETALARRGHVDAVAYADLLSDMLLTAKRLDKHLAGQTLEDRYVEELIGKTWRKTDRTPAEGLNLVEYAFHTRVTADNFVIRESRFLDLRTGKHYSEKQILPAFMASRSEPKRSYAGTLLPEASGGMYPGFSPHRLDLEGLPPGTPVTPDHVTILLDGAHATIGSALTAFQEHRKDVFAPDAYPVLVRAERLVAEDGRLRAADAAGDALHLPNDPRMAEALGLALRRGRLLAIVGDMTMDGILATLVPLAVVIESPLGAALESIAAATSAPVPTRRDRPHDGDVGHARLDRARRAGVSAAAIALGEVRLEMADALVTGLSGLVSRVTDPLVSRLSELGLDKPAAVLAELPSKAEPADRLEGFVKVHQIAGLALVRMAGATTVALAELERVPAAESIAIRRPAAVLTKEELLTARLEGRLSRYEAAWHRAKQIEAMPVDELLDEWPGTWADGEASPFIARTLASRGERAVKVAAEVLRDGTSGTTARLTAVRVLAAIGSAEASAVLRDAVGKRAFVPAVHALMAKVADVRPSGWTAAVTSLAPAKPTELHEALERLATAADKDGRLAALHKLSLLGMDDAIPAVRQVWLSDPVAEVRAHAAETLGELGDSESVEAFVGALRSRDEDPKAAKGALAGLGALGDVRAVPDILQALTQNWAGPLPGEALLRIGIAAVEPIVALVVSRRELAQRQSLQSVIAHTTSSPRLVRIFTRRLEKMLDEGCEAEAAIALLKLSAESKPVREALANLVLARVPKAEEKREKALVRAAQQTLAKRDDKP